MEQSYIEHATDEQLQQWQNERYAQIKELRRQIESLKNQIEPLKEEQERRDLEAFWKANPNSLRVNVGDKIQATQSLFRHRESTYGWPKSDDEVELGATGSVYGISIDGDNCSISFDKYCSTGGLPLRIIQDMRRAYLAAHESEGA